MNNKYAEGYPGRRYYGGCEFVDVDRAARDRPREGAVRGRARQRPAARRRPGEHGRVRRVPPAGRREREGARDGARARRPPDPRFAGQLLRACGSTSWATRSTARPSSSTWTACATSPSSTGRRSSWPGTPRIRARSTSRRSARSPTRSARSCGSTRRTSSGWSPAARTRSPVPYADVVTFTTHKALRGPRGAMILCREEHAKAIDKAVFPMMQGGPLEHCIAGKAVALKEAMASEASRTTRTGSCVTRARARRRARGRGPPRRVRRDRLAPRCSPTSGRSGSTARTPRRCCDEVGIAAEQERRSRSTRTRRRHPSGIRVGTPGPATLGMDEAEMREIGEHHRRRRADARRRGGEGEGSRPGERPDAAVPGLPRSGTPLAEAASVPADTLAKT